MIDEDDFDFDQPVTRIKQNAASQKQLGSQILKDADIPIYLTYLTIF